MIASKEMGMSEEEFWNSCPIFFNECYSEFKSRQVNRYGR